MVNLETDPRNSHNRFFSELDVQMRKTQWHIHTPNDGSNIGGVQPTNTDFLSFGTPESPNSLKLKVQGPDYATVMAYCRVPLGFGNFTFLQWDFDAIPLDSNLYLLETDQMEALTPPTGMKLTSGVLATSCLNNKSLQNLYNTGLQLVNTSGSWVSIPSAYPGALATCPHHYSILSSSNQAAGSYGIVSITIDDTIYPVVQSAPGVPSTWAVQGVNLQLQLTLKPGLGGNGIAEVVFDNMNFFTILANM